MAKIVVWWQQEDHAPPGITVHALKENKRPIGFAPWPEEEVVPPVVKARKKRKK